MYFLSTFADFRCPNSPILHAEVAQVEIGAVAGTDSKFAALRPTATGKQLNADRGVHAAVYRPIEALAQDGALLVGKAYVGHEKPGFPVRWVHRVRRHWKIKYRNVPDAKGTPINRRVASSRHNCTPRLELPFGLRQCAIGYDPVVHNIVAGTGLHHDLAGKRKRVRRCQQQMRQNPRGTDRTSCIVKPAALIANIVRSVAGLNVLLVRGAIQYD